VWRISAFDLVFPITIGIGVTAALLAWRERGEPGAVPLTWMFIGQVIWVTCSLFEMQAGSVQAKILWSELLWIGVVIIPVAWLLFSLEYTGRDQYVRPQYILLLLLVPAITVVLALTSQSHDLLYTTSKLVEFQGLVFVDRTIGPWVWVYFGYTYLLGVLGSVPLFDFIRSEATVFRGQSGAILLGTVVPWASNALYLAGFISIPAFDPTPIAFLVSGLAYLGAVTQFQLFSTTPSASQHARQVFIDQLQAGVIVIDNHDCIVDLNASATTILGVDNTTVLGQSIDTVIEQYDTLEYDPSRECQTFQSPVTGGEYDITRTELTDSRGRAVGTIYTLHDISDHVRSQQRHQVLNRLFRHNIRTETNLVVSHAEILENDRDAGDPTLIKNSALQIEETARMARKILDVFERDMEGTTRVELAELLDQCLGRIEAQYPSVTVETSSVPDGVDVDSTLDVVLLNVLENAAQHNDAADPRVRVRVAELDDAVRIEVADNGPGIDDYERAVIERGTENPLQHSSGLGLWLIKWGTEIAGGEIEFRDNEPTGTVVTVRVPTLSAPGVESDTVRPNTE